MAAEWTMNMSRIAGYEDATFTQARHLAMMNMKVAAPVQAICLDCAGRALGQNATNKLERGGVALALKLVLRPG